MLAAASLTTSVVLAVSMALAQIQGHVLDSRSMHRLALFRGTDSLALVGHSG